MGMLTVAYCRVSTEEQAAEGYSIEGQAERAKAYAALHDLGPVTVIADPGYSAKTLDRPGMQRLLTMIDDGVVAHIIIWRVDRISRDVVDLGGLIKRLDTAGITLHSCTENLDLTSATGKMHLNMLGTFAQFYREQLSENVAMGMTQAAKHGKWTNRPKTGYDLIDGELIPNHDAAAVRRIFELRAHGHSHRVISERTGINHSTVLGILKSRIYLGKVVLGGVWYPGHHEPLITPAEFDAAHRGFRTGKRRGRDLLSGRVRCGTCRRAMSIDQNGQGHTMYRCAHRGTGCRQPRRSTKGLLRAALLGLRLVASDAELQAAIRDALDGARQTALQGGGRARQRSTKALADLTERQRKLLELYYQDRISAELFHREETALSTQIEAIRSEHTEADDQAARQHQLADQFENVLAVLQNLDLDRVWEAATDQERRVLIEELLEAVTVYPDHLEVTVHGATKLNVLLSEVGLMEQSGIAGVGGALLPERTRGLRGELALSTGTQAEQT
jgi:site-specific DNA recombinase